VAAEGFKAPGVVVSYTTDPEIQNSKKFLAEGLQTAAGVPLQCDEPADFMTFRVGLFGLEKWHHVDRTVAHLAAALDRLGIGQGKRSRSRPEPDRSNLGLLCGALFHSGGPHVHLHVFGQRAGFQRPAGQSRPFP
jgi:hypothetical protein